MNLVKIMCGVSRKEKCNITRDPLKTDINSVHVYHIMYIMIFILVEKYLKQYGSYLHFLLYKNIYILHTHYIVHIKKYTIYHHIYICMYIYIHIYITKHYSCVITFLFVTRYYFY